MSKIYFDEKVNGRQLLVTESYVRYDTEFIPTRAISYVGVKDTDSSYILKAIAAGFFFLVLGGIMWILENHIDFHDFPINYFAISFALFGLLLFVVAAIISLRKTVHIASDSQHCIKIEISGLKHDKFYEPLMKALYEVVEDNNPLSNQSVS